MPRDDGRGGYTRVADTFDELDELDFKMLSMAGRVRRRKFDAELNQEVECDTDDEEHQELDEMPELIKDWSWFKIFRFLALTSMMALGFIYLMNVLISHAPESWTTPMEPGKHIFTDITGHRYTVVPGKTRDWDAHQRYMASRNKSST